MTPRIRILGNVAVIQFSLITATFFVMMAATNVLWALGFVNERSSIEALNAIQELAVRSALLFWIGASCLAVYLYRPARVWVLEQKWPLFALVLFALGAVLSIADPSHAILAEENWIRYPTAAILLMASAVALVSAFGAKPLQDRLLGLAFGILFGAGGADELLQFHERAGEFVATASPSGSPAIGQDYVTLGIALTGLIGLVAVVMFRYFSRWVADQFRRVQYQWPLYLFGISILSFLLAQVFDSFDVYLIELFDFIRLQMTGTVPTGNGESWLDVVDIGRYMNSLEEMLEYLAAVGFLMMVGKLFAVPWLLCSTSSRGSPRSSRNRACI